MGNGLLRLMVAGLFKTVLLISTASDLMGEIVPKMLFTAVDRQGVPFLWPVRSPTEDGRLDAWNQSAL